MYDKGWYSWSQCRIVCYLSGRISGNNFMLMRDLQNNILIKINNENLVSEQIVMI